MVKTINKLRAPKEELVTEPVISDETKALNEIISILKEK